jgi:hypothetical protein
MIPPLGALTVSLHAARSGCTAVKGAWVILIIVYIALNAMRGLSCRWHTSSVQCYMFQYLAIFRSVQI